MNDYDDDDVMDAESFAGEEDYEDEYEDEEEEDLLFGKIPRTPGLMAIGVIIVAILLLLASLVSNGFGFRGGISDVNVDIPNTEGDLSDDKLEINAQTGVPAFGSDYQGDGKLVIIYDETEIYSTNLKFTDSRASKNIPYQDFYVDNGEYTVEVNVDGKTEIDTIELKRTVHAVSIIQYDYMVSTGGSGGEEKEKVQYSFSFFPETTDDPAILPPGEGVIEFYYVEDEGDASDEEMWENVTSIDFTTDFQSVSYKDLQGTDQSETNLEGGFFFGMDSDELMEEKEQGEGFYSARIYFTNTYGLEEYGAFTGTINGMPEEGENSKTWAHLGDDEGQ